MIPDRPLDGIASIRTKIAILVGASILGAVLTYEIGKRAGVTGWVTLPVTLGVALAVSHYLSRGLVQPLRDLTAAAGRMAEGDYTVRTEAGRADETGELARAFNDMADQLAGHDRQRRELIATVSHELRTPLALISGHVDSLLDLGLDPAAQRRSVERIGTAAARLQALVDELLDLTQLEHASLALHRSRLEVAELVELVTGGLGEWPGMPPVSVTVPLGLPPVHVDAVRIGHVLVNLVDNARHYGRPGGVIGIRARRQRATVVITVEDEGPGIPPEERPHVFDRLYRGRAARESHPGGTGLGLHVCRRLVEAHGGRIWIEPDDGRSAISFSLPVARRNPARRGGAA